jgi:predicted DNA-binding transcriptional regulator YafY
MDPDQRIKIVEIDYTNHAGERGRRRILPLRMTFKSTEWHPVAQWILDAFDVDKLAERSFAVKDIHSWIPYR